MVHFKELFALDGKETNLSDNDIARRNTITKLLKDWELVEVAGELNDLAPLSQIKIISFKEKDEWNLETKYNIGKNERFKMIVDALRKKYEYEIISAGANIDVYLRNPAGIGEHPDIVAAVDSEMEKLASAEDKLSSLNSNFNSSLTNPQVLNEQRKLGL